jgi:RNA polymerase sigma factor (TIGR02999 family)
LTVLLRQSVTGDTAAREQLWARVHDQLRSMARGRLARESSSTALDATELVHEAFFKLESLTIEPRDRLHFLALAARAMRQVLVEQARARRRDKRGGGQAPVTLLTGTLRKNNPARWTCWTWNRPWLNSKTWTNARRVWSSSVTSAA